MKNMIQGIFLLLAMITSTVLFAEPVNINTAEASAMAAEIKGVGIKRAHAIVEYREQHGDFSSVDALANVKGIGPAIIEKNRDKLTAGEDKLGQSGVSMKQ